MTHVKASRKAMGQPAVECCLSFSHNNSIVMVTVVFLELVAVVAVAGLVFMGGGAGAGVGGIDTGGYCCLKR